MQHLYGIDRGVQGVLSLSAMEINATNAVDESVFAETRIRESFSTVEAVSCGRIRLTQIHWKRKDY
jgi:hypothetical protein